MSKRYWIVVASRDHVQAGVSGGFAQACHGKASPLRRMRPGDGVIYYSPKTVFGTDEKCRRFAAIGEVGNEDVRQADMGGGFLPFRRAIRFFACEEASILPLLPALSFIRDKQRWGGAFRFGLLEIPGADYRRIATAMQVSAPEDGSAA